MAKKKVASAKGDLKLRLAVEAAVEEWFLDRIEERAKSVIKPKTAAGRSALKDSAQLYREIWRQHIAEEKKKRTRKKKKV